MFKEIEDILTEAVKLCNDMNLTNAEKQKEAERFSEAEFDKISTGIDPTIRWIIKTFLIPVGIKWAVAYLKSQSVI